MTPKFRGAILYILHVQYVKRVSSASAACWCEAFSNGTVTPNFGDVILYILHVLRLATLFFPSLPLLAESVGPGFGSCFRTLAVILVSDFCTGHGLDPVLERWQSFLFQTFVLAMVWILF